MCTLVNFDFSSKPWVKLHLCSLICTLVNTLLHLLGFCIRSSFHQCWKECLFSLENSPDIELVGSRTRTECSCWPWEVLHCFGRDEELDVRSLSLSVSLSLSLSVWMSALTSRGPSLLWMGWRARCVDAVTRTHTKCPRWPREGQSLLWTEWRARCLYRAVSGSVHPDGHDMTRALCSQLASGLTGSRSLTFRWVELLDHTLWCSGCPPLILCRLVGSDPMQLGAAMLHVDWLDGRTLGDWHLG
jgi:hypothetical protein